MTRDRAHIDVAVFPYLQNQAAFFDKAVIDVWGTLRKRIAPGLMGNTNLAIGGKGRFYARCLKRTHVVSGNELQVKYGRTRRYPNLSPLVLTIWAGKSPVTCADVLLALDSLVRRNYRCRVSAVEVTFDIVGTPLSQLEKSLCSRLRIFPNCSEGYSSTIYVGKPRSPRQVRIYQKTVEVVRLEFILRRAFLRDRGINRPQDLLRLKQADLWTSVSSRQVDETKAHLLPRRLREYWESFGWKFPPYMPPSIVQRALREERVVPDTWVKPSPVQCLFLKMQDRLLW